MDTLEAIELAIQDHLAYCKQKGAGPDFEYISALREAAKIVTEHRKAEAA